MEGKAALQPPQRFSSAVMCCVSITRIIFIIKTGPDVTGGKIGSLVACHCCYNQENLMMEPRKEFYIMSFYLPPVVSSGSTSISISNYHSIVDQHATLDSSRSCPRRSGLPECQFKPMCLLHQIASCDSFSFLCNLYSERRYSNCSTSGLGYSLFQEA